VDQAQGGLTRPRRREATSLLLLPAALWYLLFFLLPLLFPLAFSLGRGNPYGQVALGFSLENYRALWDPVYLKVFWTTLRMALLGAVGCLLVGFPLAYYLAIHRPARRLLLLALVVVPFWTSFLIRTYAWLILLNTKGLVNGVLLGLGLLSQELDVLYSPTAIWFGLVYNYLPLMVLPLYVSLERIDRRLLEAARDLGASAFATFRHVIIPLATPGIITGILLVFIPLTGEYIIPELLGGGKSILWGNFVGNQFTTARDWAFGSAAAMALIGVLAVTLPLLLRTGERAGKVW